MNPTEAKSALHFSVDLRLETPLLLRSGEAGEDSDSSIEKSPDGWLHINGYVWAGLIRRALRRVGPGDAVVGKIGKYIPEKEGISPLWTESCFASLPMTTMRPGIKIDRQHRAATIGGAFLDELVPPGLRVKCEGNWFASNRTDLHEIRERLIDSLWVVDQGIENVGGGWSYGFGKLSVEAISLKDLDLEDSEDRSRLWQFAPSDWMENHSMQDFNRRTPDISRPWIGFCLDLGVADGQLLAVGSKMPPFDLTAVGGGEKELPDAFLFRRPRLTDDGLGFTEEVVIPGKSMRQALLSAPLERWLNSAGSPVCPGSGLPKLESDFLDNNCSCLRCKWFGSSAQRGIISVADAPIADPQTLSLRRIKLCEHSHQNINMFSGEYLQGSRFPLDILIDVDAGGAEAKQFVDHLLPLLREMQRATWKAPAGWHRLGATAACTGQVEILNKKIEPATFGVVPWIDQDSLAAI
jgi:hypothetical protein